MTREELDALELADQAALHERRLRLRAMADRIIDAMDALPPPKGWLEGGRQMRAVAATDRALVQLYSPPRRTRKPPAKPASRPIDPAAMQALRKFEHTARQLHKVENAIAAHERAVAAKAPPAPKPEPAPEPDARPDYAGFANESPEVVAEVMAVSIDKVVRRCAEFAGVWPDGAPFDAAEADWRLHTLTAPVDLPAGIAFEDAARAVMPAILDGCNACTRCAAENLGQWPGGKPCHDDDPEFWSMTAAFEDPRADTSAESPGPACLPPWIVHRKPPDRE